MLEKILAQLVNRLLRKRLTCFYQRRFLLCYRNICKIVNNLHNFDLRVSSCYSEQFHNKNQNCLIAFPINLTVGVEELGTVYSEPQYFITPTYSRC